MRQRASGNPFLREKTFNSELAGSAQMTVQGTANKAGVLLLLVLATAAYTWGRAMDGFSVDGLMMTGALLGFVLAITVFFTPRLAPILAPGYALLEGFFVGGLSVRMEMLYPGLVLQAVFLTFGVALSMWFLYATGTIKVTQGLMRGVAAATMGIMLVYLAGFALSFAGIGIPLIHESGPVGIAFSLFVVGLAAFNLIIDFAFIESSARNGAPKKMEWLGAFALTVTLVWLYIEVLRLLGKLRN